MLIPIDKIFDEEHNKYFEQMDKILYMLKKIERFIFQLNKTKKIQIHQ
jgi:uncharacterized membrane protein YgaE (UPF0421/DUF939 family)